MECQSNKFGKHWKYITAQKNTEGSNGSIFPLIVSGVWQPDTVEWVRLSPKATAPNQSTLAQREQNGEEKMRCIVERNHFTAEFREVCLWKAETASNLLLASVLDRSKINPPCSQKRKKTTTDFRQGLFGSYMLSCLESIHTTVRIANLTLTRDLHFVCQIEQHEGSP